MWINGYFPTDNKLINYDETDLQSVLFEVDRLMEGSQYDEIVIGADFNWDWICFLYGEVAG